MDLLRNTPSVSQAVDKLYQNYEALIEQRNQNFVNLGTFDRHDLYYSNDVYRREIKNKWESFHYNLTDDLLELYYACKDKKQDSIKKYVGKILVKNNDEETKNLFLVLFYFRCTDVIYSLINKFKVQPKEDLIGYICELSDSYELFNLMGGTLKLDTIVGLSGENALTCAILNNNIPVIKKLLKHSNVDVNKVDSKNMTPLFRSIYNKQTEIVKLLLQHPDIDLSWTNKEDEDYLETAIQTNNYETIKLLLDKHGTKGFQSLTQCFFNSVSDMMVKNDVVELFLNYVDVNCKDDYGKTALLQACKIYQRDKLQLLLQHGADVCIKDDSDNTVLMLLIEQCDTSYKDILTKVEKSKLKECINQKNIRGESPLFLAIKIYNLEAIDDLVDLGANINDADIDGTSCLTQTIIKNNKHAFDLLLSKGVDINKSDNNGLTPAMHTVRMITLDDDCTFLDIKFSKHHDYFLHKLLTDDRLDVNYKNNFGHTLLNLLILTKLGVHKFESNKSSNGAFSDGLASYPECFRTELAGSEPKKIDVEKLKGWFNTIINRLVVREDVDINSSDNFGATPLYLAIEHKDLDLFNILIKCDKLDINDSLLDQNGLTYGMFVYQKLSGNGTVNFLSGSGSTTSSLYPLCGGEIQYRPISASGSMSGSMSGCSSSTNLNKKVNYDHDYSKYYYMLKTLINHPNYDLDNIDYDGDTLLTNICKGSSGSENILLNDLLTVSKDGKQLNLDVQNNGGYTPLMYGVENKRWSVVELLLKVGCDTDLKNKDGKSVKDIANGNLFFDKLVKKYKNSSGWF